MDWELEQMWIAHQSGHLSYNIRHTEDVSGSGKYIAAQVERTGISINSLPIGEYDTLEEAQAACDQVYEDGGLKAPPLPVFTDTVKAQPQPRRN